MSLYSWHTFGKFLILHAATDCDRVSQVINEAIDTARKQAEAQLVCGLQETCEPSPHLNAALMAYWDRCELSPVQMLL